MKPITSTQEPMELTELQQIEKAILERVAAFCETHGIRYSLCGGTLLGAVRHKGFIPWDNDVDIFMPRPDYERFTAEFSVEGLSLHTFEKEASWHYPYVKITDDRTVAFEEGWEQFEIGVHIDVFPLDGFPDNTKSIRRAVKERTFFMAVSDCVFNTTIYKWHKPGRPLYKTLRVWLFKSVCWVFPKRLFLSLFTKRMSRFGYDNQPCVACAIWGLYGEREVMPRSCTDTFTDVEFEGRLYKAIASYPTYLSNIYGDYMTLPPPEQRKVHPIKAWWR